MRPWISPGYTLTRSYGVRNCSDPGHFVSAHPYRAPFPDRFETATL
jgi:hypothetical protein